MTNTGRPHHPDRKPALALLFALIGAAFSGAACAGQPTETVLPQAAGVVVAQAAAPGGDGKDQAPTLTPLGRAALYGDVEAARRQLGEGADPDAVSAWQETPLMLSFSPLILAPAKCGGDPDGFQAYRARRTRKLRIARLLLDRGADLALVDGHGMTALHALVLMYAEERALVETLQALMAKGADPNAANSTGTTPLMFAAQRDRRQLVQALLSAGADPKAIATDGHTALSIARERGHAELAELLARRL